MKMRTSMMKPMGYLFLRWRSVVALLGGILVAMAMLLFALSKEPAAQTTGPIQAIAAGDQHAMAIVNSPYYGPGLVYAWGDNYYGQVGDNTIHNNRFPPTRVVDSDGEGYLTGVKAIEGGSQHSLALKSDGTVWAWGLNDDCQLGIVAESPFTCPAGPIDHSYAKRPTAVLLPSGSQMTAIAAGYNHSLAVRNDGSVWAWGQGRYGQLGVNSDNPHGTPVQVHGLNNGQPSEGYGLSGIKDVAGGRWHSLALGANGDVYAWGDNSGFQLGTDSQEDSKYPVRVHGLNNAGTLTGVLDIAAGEVHNLAIVSDGTADNVANDGTVWAWGDNAKGQLGCHSNTSHGYPVQVKGGAQGLDPSGHDVLHDIVAVAAGENHSLAVDTDGHVYAWGGGYNGQLGVNSNNDHTIPYQVHGLNNGQPPDNGLSGIADVAAGEFFSMALKNDGTAVYAWGGNSYGQIDATLQDHRYPVQVGGLASATPPDQGTGKPEVTDMVPAPGATGVFRRTTVAATFSEEMDKSTLTKENFRLYEISAKKGPIQITNVSVTPNPEGTEVTLDHKPLGKDTAYVAVLTTGVKDLDGNAMATNEFWRFETGSQMGQ